MKLSLRFWKRSQTLLGTPLPGFDPVWYRYWYRDVVGYGEGVLAHYVTRGWREGRDPSAGFSTDGYLRANPDVREAGLNPLIHFLENGLAEGRSGYEKSPNAPAPQPRQATPLLLTAPRVDRAAQPGPSSPADG